MSTINNNSTQLAQSATSASLPVKQGAVQLISQNFQEGGQRQQDEAKKEKEIPVINKLIQKSLQKNGGSEATTPANTITGTGGNDSLRGTRGNDIIKGKGGNDVINGNRGDDVIHGGQGKDSIRGVRLCCAKTHLNGETRGRALVLPFFCLSGSGACSIPAQPFTFFSLQIPAGVWGQRPHSS